MQWIDANRIIEGIDRECRVLTFSISAGTSGGIELANSNGVIEDITENFLEFNPLMFERFDITIDQLEGEINCPYIFQRQEPVLDGNGNLVFEENGQPQSQTEIIVPKSLLGGFVQFRINYQFIYYPSDPLASRILSDLDGDGQLDGVVFNGSVETPRTLVPRRPYEPPPPPPPVFTIDEGQIKEALADKIYEKFFDSPEIMGDLADVMSLQTTTSEDGINYGMGRTSEDQQLILFKKDRNTPENKKDFEGDGSDGIQAIANNISASLAFTDANGVVDLSDKLDDELSILSTKTIPRILSTDPNYFDPPIYASGSSTEADTFLQITKYTLKYTGFGGVEIDVDFAELWEYFQNSIPLPDAYGGDPKTPGYNDEWKNKLNLSQLTMPKTSKRIDADKALTTLDTNIFELLPTGNQRQLQIDNFFDLFNQLIGTTPSFDDGNEDNIPETIVNEPDDLTRRITSAPDNLNAFITRTDKDVQLGLESTNEDLQLSATANQGKTLESMRNRLNDFLYDIDSVVEEVDDSRPEYENQSSGFLKLRRLNQSILIKGASATPSFGNWTEDGFTITMWVRFLNTTGGGSLFTYGNPMMRTKSSFRLETMTVQEGDPSVSYEGVDYTYAKARRVLRLVVWEDRRDDPWWQEKIDTNEMNWNASWERRLGYLYDSSVPHDITDDVWTQGKGSLGQGFAKLPSFHSQLPASDIPNRKNYFLNYTNIPTDDLEEWFFVCATYDPSINEIGSFGADFPNYYGGFDFHLSNPNDDLRPGTLGFGNGNTQRKDDLFWLGHKNQSGSIVSRSGFGNRCKVEIISRSDLLRARGYRV